MEKYGQYRDKGSGIAPFFPISPPATSPLLLPWHLFLFSVRIPFIAFAWFVWLGLIQWLPAGSALRKANQWCLLGIPGVWWVDIQIDGVRRGSLAQGGKRRLPYPGTIIASSWTSPLDVLYLAAIFDPIFTKSYRDSKLVRPIPQEGALAGCFNITDPFALLKQSEPLTSLDNLVKQNPNRVIVVFPEGTTSNGRGILKLTPSLTSAAPETKVFPVSLKYTPADVVTPIPGWLEGFRFIWRLNSAPSHCIRVRIGTAMSMASPPSFSGGSNTGPQATTSARRGGAEPAGGVRGGFETNYFDTLQASSAQTSGDEGEGSEDDGVTNDERQKLNAVADDLARLGRVKRVSLGVEEKARFIAAWAKRAKSRK